MSHCVSWSELPEAETPSGGGKRVVQGDGGSLVMVRVPAGRKAPRHAHPHEQCVQVMSGSGVLETDEGRRPFGPGTVFHFPPNTFHAAEFTTDTVLIETNFA